MGSTMDGCGKCMKYSLFVANFIILIGGIAVLGVGIWTVVDKATLEALLDTNLFFSAAYIQIATGIVIIFLSFLGCCGAMKEVKCMLLTYSILLFLLFIVLLVAGILGYVFRDKVEDSIDMAMKKSLHEYDDRLQDPVRLAWDDAQKKFECCGVDRPEDWQSNTNLKGRYPKSCCRIDSDGDTLHCESSVTNTWKVGCRQKVEMYLREHGAVLGGIGIGIAFLTLLGIIFGCALCKTIE
ncbi:unnamed protein product [Darwinula stevensoni]|uniref:Tetraspanin n=1 Tax=Darwinula stevensoni TaxID=69355 RepID=A0A7R9A6X2_9CRUS|nr:unnamed protein product [Darwinula stevensoni]CAG0895927.1 unnamed protein product [Darwinula stevensoni]